MVMKDGSLLTAEEAVRRSLAVVEEARRELGPGGEERVFANYLDKCGWTIVPKEWVVRADIFGSVAIVREGDGVYHLLSSSDWRIERTPKER